MNLPTETFGKLSPEFWDFLSREDERFSFRERKNDDIFVVKFLSFVLKLIPMFDPPSWGIASAPAMFNRCYDFH